MRKIQIAFAAISFIAVAETGSGQADPLTAIRDALTAKYRLTRTTAHETSLVTTGSVLVLKKNNLLGGNAISTIPISNTYKAGRISQGITGQIARGTAATRTFITGETLWVTGIEVTSKGIVFALFSDSYSGLHYRTSLTFPFIRGSIPSPTEAAAIVSEVFDTEDSGADPVSGHLAGDRQQVSSSQQNMKTSNPEPDNTPWDSKYGRMTAEDLLRIKDPTVVFDVNYLRLSPAALDQKPVMQYFIALNNCNDLNIDRALFNELDYPALATFYKLKAPQILASLPRTVTDVALYRYIGGQQSGDWVLWSKSLSLGEYDRQRKVFPLKYPGKDSVEISDSLSTQSSARNLGKTCPAAARTARAVHLLLPSTYIISLKPAVYRELPMEEDAARRYIDHATPQRNVFLAVDVTILDSAPSLSRSSNGLSQANLRAQTARIRVIDGKTERPLGALFDDHRLAGEVEVAQAPPPAPARAADSFAFGDHMYDIRTAVYIVLAADACSWPLPAEQNANVRRFAGQVSARGNFNEKYQYSLAIAQTRNAINANGRLNYCADAAERRKFDKLAATVAPAGPLAAPATK